MVLERFIAVGIVLIRVVDVSVVDIGIVDVGVVDLGVVDLGVVDLGLGGGAGDTGQKVSRIVERVIGAVSC